MRGEKKKAQIGKKITEDAKLTVLKMQSPPACQIRNVQQNNTALPVQLDLSKVIHSPGQTKDNKI